MYSTITQKTNCELLYFDDDTKTLEEVEEILKIEFADEVELRREWDEIHNYRLEVLLPEEKHMQYFVIAALEGFVNHGLVFQMKKTDAKNQSWFDELARLVKEKRDKYLFRDLTAEEEVDFRSWARSNYEPNTEISEIWHPVVQDECLKINAEYRYSD